MASIEKSGEAVSERSAYVVRAGKAEPKELLCRLWRCAVTPMSLVYVPENEPRRVRPHALHCPQS